VRRGRAAALAAGVALGVAACGPIWSSPPDPKEHVRGEHHRLFHESADVLWPKLVRALDEEGIPIARSDRAKRLIETGRVRQSGADVVKRLRDIADLSNAHEQGLGRVTEYAVSYRLFLTPAGPDTSVKVASAIDAVDRTEQLVGPGGLQVFPHHIDVPSRGVVERDLLRRLAASWFSTEEMLLVLGEPGLD